MILEKNTPPIPNSYWLEPGRVLCGEFPRDFEGLEDIEGMSALLGAGIRVFIDLTERGELKPYRGLAIDTAGEMKIDPVTLEFHRYSITDGTVPHSTGLMRAILKTVQSALNRELLVYIHCYGGRGRTGTVAGCVLSEIYGHQGEEALSVLAERWQACAKRDRECPETDEQREFVREWNSRPT